MNQIIQKNLGIFKNVETVTKSCWCSVHRGDILHQLNAELPNGNKIVIMQDMYGYHITVGDYDPAYCPPGVSEREALQIIREAISL